MLYLHKRVLSRFLIELDMKPHMHLVKISIFSINNVTVRLTKTINNFLEHLKLQILKSFFSLEYFQKKFL